MISDLLITFFLGIVFGLCVSLLVYLPLVRDRKKEKVKTK